MQSNKMRHALQTFAGWVIVVALVQLLIWTAVTYSIPKEMEHRAQMTTQAKYYAAACMKSATTSY